MKVAAQSVQFELRRRTKTVAILLEFSSIDEAAVIYGDFVELSNKPKPAEINFKLTVGPVIERKP